MFLQWKTKRKLRDAVSILILHRPPFTTTFTLFFLQPTYIIAVVLVDFYFQSFHMYVPSDLLRFSLFYWCCIVSFCHFFMSTAVATLYVTPPTNCVGWSSFFLAYFRQKREWIWSFSPLSTTPIDLLPSTTTRIFFNLKSENSRSYRLRQLQRPDDNDGNWISRGVCLCFKWCVSFFCYFLRSWKSTK